MKNNFTLLLQGGINRTYLTKLTIIIINEKHKFILVVNRFKETVECNMGLLIIT